MKFRFGLIIFLCTTTGFILASTFGFSNDGYKISNNGSIMTTASTGSRALIVWKENGNLFGKIIVGSGEPISSKITITGANGLENNNSIALAASNGQNFLVVWRDFRRGDNIDPDLYGQIISKNGTKIGANFAIANEKDSYDSIHGIAAGPSNYAVVYSRGDFLANANDNYRLNLVFQKIRANGNLVGPRKFLGTISGGSFPIDSQNRLARLGDKHAVVYTDNNSKAKAAILDSAGNIEGSTINIGDVEVDGVVGSANKFFVYYDKNQHVKLRLLSKTGTWLGPEKKIADWESHRYAVFEGFGFLYYYGFYTNGYGLLRISKETGAVIGEPFMSAFSPLSVSGNTVALYRQGTKIKAAPLSLIDTINPKIEGPVDVLYSPGNTWSLKDILKMTNDPYDLFEVDKLRDNLNGGSSENWGLLKLQGCLSKNKATDNDTWNTECGTHKRTLKNYTIPYPYTDDDVVLSSFGAQGPVYGAFASGDGTAQFNMKLFDAEASTSNVFYYSRQYKIDQYAPCDNPNQSICGITINDSNGHNRTLTQNGLPTSVINNLDFNLNLTAVESPGEGVVSDGTKYNVRILVTHHDGSLLQTEAGVLNAGLAEVRDRSCSLEAGLDDQSSDQIYPPGVFRTGQPWENILSSTLLFRYLSTGMAMAIHSDTPDAYGKTLRSAIQGLLGASGPDAATDGTILIAVCVRDRAGNWSRFIDVNDTDLVQDEDKPNYQGYSLPINVAEFDPAKNGFNKTGTSISAYLPRLVHRIYIDGAAPDNGCSSGSDPCSIVELDPKPVYTLPSEGAVFMGFSPPNFSATSSVTVGVKLPEDSSGIAGLYYRIGSSPSGQQNGTYVPSSQFVPCNNVIVQNERPLNSGWVDACFEVTSHTADFLHVWLVDNGGNIGFGSGGTAVRKRQLLVDNIGPSTPSNLRLIEDPIMNSRPYLSWDNSVDSSGVREYKLCFWPKNENFTNDIIKSEARLHGSCPTPEIINVPSSEILSLIVPASFGPTGEFQWPENIQPLPLGRFDVTLIAFDYAGNPSQHAYFLTLINSDGKGRLDYTNETEKMLESGSTVETGPAGTYTFKIRYTDINNEPPYRVQLWIDLNGDGKLDHNEKRNMAPESTSGEGETTVSHVKSIDFETASEQELRDYYKSLALNRIFYDGEDYVVKVELKYPPKTNGLVKYKFLAENKFGEVIDGSGPGDPVTGTQIYINPYGDFDGRMLIYNNNYKCRGKKPTFSIKKASGKNPLVSVHIYTVRGTLVRKLIHRRRFNNLPEFFRWDTRADNGKKVPNGLYYGLYLFPGGKAYKKIFINCKGR